jgi:type I protein arginine methyltransferase
MRDVKKEQPAARSSELPRILPEWAAAHSLHYQLLANQQLMLEDVHRTSKYHSGVLENASDFAGKVVLDVGAGTGILSLFAAQAGAKKIYAVEATSAADYACKLIEHAGLAERIEVLRGRLDEIEIPDKVEVIISEPWGFFLFHERMIEVFLSARDRFLVDGGRLFPSAAKVWLAPFRDDELYEWRCDGIAFWERSNFFGVDLSALAETARRELFEMPAVGLVDPAGLSAEPVGYEFDLSKMSVNDLAVVRLPFRFVATNAGFVHGLAGWFDVVLAGSSRSVTLSTGPHSPPTHWAQVRFLFSTPIELDRGQILRGILTLTANAESSYDATVEVAVEQQARVHRQNYRLQTYFSWQGGG